MKRTNKFNRVKKQGEKRNNPENYKRTYYLKRKKGTSNPTIGMAYKLQHLNKILGYTGEDDTWQAMSPEQIKKYEDERKRLIEILTPIHLEYNRKHFSKTFHTEED
jgi:hypothetical protein